MVTLCCISVTLGLNIIRKKILERFLLREDSKAGNVHWMFVIKLSLVSGYAGITTSSNISIGTIPVNLSG